MLYWQKHHKFETLCGNTLPKLMFLNDLLSYVMNLRNA